MIRKTANVLLLQKNILLKIKARSQKKVYLRKNLFDQKFQNRPLLQHFMLILFKIK